MSQNNNLIFLWWNLFIRYSLHICTSLNRTLEVFTNTCLINIIHTHVGTLLFIYSYHIFNRFSTCHSALSWSYTWVSVSINFSVSLLYILDMLEATQALIVTCPGTMMVRVFFCLFFCFCLTSANSSGVKWPHQGVERTTDTSAESSRKKVPLTSCSGRNKSRQKTPLSSPTEEKTVLFDDYRS